jgi:predicted nucleotidyltransferase
MSWNSAEVRFIDLEQVIRDLRRAVAEARSRYPEIKKVFLFGSLVNGTWTADSDADVIVVVAKNFEDFFESCRYQIYTDSIPVDSLVYSEPEFNRLLADSTSFLAQNVALALEL